MQTVAHTRRTASRLAAAAAAAAIACSALAAGAQAAAPQATPLEKVSTVVQPSVVYMQMQFSGLVRDGQGREISSLIQDGQGGDQVEGRAYGITGTCTGFVVNPNGYIGTAGHCVDLDYFSDLIVEQLAQALLEAGYGPALFPQATSAEEFMALAQDEWTVVSAKPQHTQGPDRLVYAAWGTDVGGGPTGRALPARVLAYRPLENGDVALIKIEAEDLPALELAPTARIDVGTEAISVGFPGSVSLVSDQSFNASYKHGAISSKKTTGKGLFGVYEISAPMSQGMSGGPTVDIHGRVIGVNSYSPRMESQPFNFISPSSEMAQLMRDQGVRNEIGESNGVYRSGLRAFFAGDRAAALAQFDRVLDVQPSHELARKFRVKALRLPAVKADGGLPPVAIGIMLAAVLAAAAGMVVALRRRSQGPDAGDTDGDPAPFGGGPVGPQPALVVQDGPLAGRRYLVGTELVIGREQADVCLEDPQVSRRHAAVRPMERGIEVEDLGSANGTTVNGMPLAGRRRLRNGDVIQVGRMRLAADVPEPRRQETLLPGIRRDALLIVRDGILEGQRFPVAGEVLIGREDADVTLEDAQVSRRHAIVRPVAGGIEIEDLHSANGTYVNGDAIRSVRLSTGDVIRVGRISLEAQVGPGMAGGAQPTVVGASNGNGH